jgi:hypothetical protein
MQDDDTSTTAAAGPVLSEGLGAGGAPAAPMRAMRLTLKMEADDADELACALRNMAAQIERGELTVGVSGGPHSGAIYELLTDPKQTHENYFRQVQEYLREKRA